MREGQACASLPFVLDGGIRVFKTAESGREITLYRIESGQSCILSTGCGAGIISFPATAVAEKATIAVFMPSATVKRMLAKGPAFRDYILEQYSRRMAEVMELVEEVAFRRVDERLAQWLIEHSIKGEPERRGRGRPHRRCIVVRYPPGARRPRRNLSRGGKPHPEGLGAEKSARDLSRLAEAAAGFFDRLR